MHTYTYMCVWMRAHIYFLLLIGAAGDMKSMNRKINGGRSAFSETFSIHLKSQRKIYSAQRLLRALTRFSYFFRNLSVWSMREACINNGKRFNGSLARFQKLKFEFASQDQLIFGISTSIIIVSGFTAVMLSSRWL